MMRSLSMTIVLMLTVTLIAACGSPSSGRQVLPTDFETADFSLTGYSGYFPHTVERSIAVTGEKELLYNFTISCWHEESLTHVINERIALSDEEYETITDAYNETGCMNVDPGALPACPMMDSGSTTFECRDGDEVNSISMVAGCSELDDFRKSLSQLILEMNQIVESNIVEPDSLEICGESRP